MRDGHHGAAKALQKLLQPLHALGVQVVGRLVQQQHVGLAQEQLAQRHAALFAAGEVFDHRIPRRQAQRVSGNFELVLAVGTGGGDDGLQLALFLAQRVEVGVRLGVGGIDFIQPCTRIVHFFHRLFHGLAHGVLGVELGLLRQVANVQPRHGRGFALDLFIDAGHDLEQGGLARAVQPQHADLGARKEAQRNVFQDLPLGRHDLADAVHGVNILRHGGTFLKTIKEFVRCKTCGQKCQGVCLLQGLANIMQTNKKKLGRQESLASARKRACNQAGLPAPAPVLRASALATQNPRLSLLAIARVHSGGRVFLIPIVLQHPRRRLGKNGTQGLGQIAACYPFGQ